MVKSIPLQGDIAGTPRTARERGAAAFMVASAFGALFSFASALGAAVAAGPATQEAEVWRLLGFAMFTGAFVLLTIWPRRYPGLWELAIADKVALTTTEILLMRNSTANAQSTAIVDGILTVVLLTAYVLSRGYTSWSTGHAA